MQEDDTIKLLTTRLEEIKHQNAHQISPEEGAAAVLAEMVIA